ncbi:MAG: TldD/PmbA family protein [Thermoplasmata archaeon]|nr:TldD/PmbA family protein [Thermoplasmata archaeon]
MTADNGSLAGTIADVLGQKVDPPWDLFAQRLRRYEVHLSGRRVELLRGPIHLTGFGVRVLRPSNGSTQVGMGSSNDLTPEGIMGAVERATAVSRFSSFPASEVHLPSGSAVRPGLELTDPEVRDRPEDGLRRFSDELLAQFDGRNDPIPSFGSVKATYAENSVVNSSGERVAWSGTGVELEFAVKSVGGPEGAAPGEYWVNSRSRRLDAVSLGVDVPRWAKLASDMRRAKPPPTGELTVAFPTDVLAEILPPILGFRLTGAAELRGLAPELASRVGSELVHVTDEPFLPWGGRSAPIDDEGTAHAPLHLLEAGTVSSRMYDVLHGSKFGHPSTGHGSRLGGFGDEHRFASGVAPGMTNLVLRSGDGGTDQELIAAIGEGLWLEQLGYPFPDNLGGTYGGEIRAAYRIRGGKLAEAVRGGTVGGSLLGAPGAPSLLAGVSHLGSRNVLCGAYSGPTVVAKGIAVAGPG